MPRQPPRSKKSSVAIVKPHLPVPHLPSPTPSSFGQIVKEGVAFGVGQAVAHRAVASVAGMFTSTAAPRQDLTCEKEWEAFESCIKIKSADEYCGSEQLSYTQCLRLTKPEVQK